MGVFMSTLVLHPQDPRMISLPNFSSIVHPTASPDLCSFSQTTCKSVP